jgi:hypothetical protein
VPLAGIDDRTLLDAIADPHIDISAALAGALEIGARG